MAWASHRSVHAHIAHKSSVNFSKQSYEDLVTPHYLQVHSVFILIIESALADCVALNVFLLTYFTLLISSVRSETR
jgi:hypothetical protein